MIGHVFARVLFSRENISKEYVDRIIATVNSKNWHRSMNTNKQEIKQVEMDRENRLKYLRISNQVWQMFVD